MCTITILLTYPDRQQYAHEQQCTQRSTHSYTMLTYDMNLYEYIYKYLILMLI